MEMGRRRMMGRSRAGEGDGRKEIRVGDGAGEGMEGRMAG